MTEQAMPNPIELYQAAAETTRGIIASIRPDQMSASTPCSEWNVGALVEHLVGGAAFFGASLAGEEPQPPSGGGSPADSYDTLTKKVISEAGNPGAMEKKYNTPFGEMAGGEFMFGAFMDTFVHGWDLAKATGQDTSLNGDFAGMIYQGMAPMMDGMRQGGAFGAAVSVPDSASIQDKMLGMLGRKP
ncbi:MAG: TIGR03086 family metal-binding protein [Chloroflexi bacterium]|nr:TIGR03086 family metal-binding protein [Chloroflexota bacterium]MDA1226755.1 TIGR03086 family metal-binding protein [Chloroflexota bacterium]